MKQINTVLLLLIPFTLSVASGILNSFAIAAVATIAIFLVVNKAPICHKRETLWLFNVSFICMIPINVFVLCRFPQIKLLLGTSDIKNRLITVLSEIEALLLLLSIEEILIALIGRLLWPRQYALKLPEPAADDLDDLEDIDPDTLNIDISTTENV